MGCGTATLARATAVADTLRTATTPTRTPAMANTTDRQVAEWREAFDLIDVDRSGSISVGELGTALKYLGKSPSKATVDALVREVDGDTSGQVRPPGSARAGGGRARTRGVARPSSAPAYGKPAACRLSSRSFSD
jgi:hypothetical protein